MKEYQFPGELALLSQYLLSEDRLSSFNVAVNVAVNVDIGKELDQSGITTARASKESDAIFIAQESQRNADNRCDPRFTSGFGKSDRPSESISIGQGERWHPISRCSSDQVLW